MEHFPWWNETQRKLTDEARQVVDEEILPLAERYCWKKEYPWEIMTEIAKRGWFGALIPEKYGGHRGEWGVTGACILNEELSRAGEAAVPLGLTMFGGSHQLEHYGTEEQRWKWLPRIARGELLGAVAMTEPYAGSDIAEIETTAVRKGDTYIVNGKKRFQSNAAAAGFYIFYVKTSDNPEDRKSYNHLTALALEKGTPGFSIEKTNDLIGWDGIYNSYLDFSNAEIPVANRIGEEGDGWRILTSGLNVERLIASAQSLGQMRESLRYAVQHLQRRVQFGQTTADIATNQFKVADMLWKLNLSRLLTYYSAYLADLGRDIPLESAMAKLFNSDSAFEVAAEAIQCMGGNALTRYYPNERLIRDAKLYQIVAGTNEIMKLVIFRQGMRNMAKDLKAPRRVIDDELKVPMPVAQAPRTKAVSEEDVLKVLADNYRVNPGLHMTIEDIKEELDISDEDLNKYLLSLEERGLVALFRNRRGVVTLTRATLNGISSANPLEYYKYTPSWVDEKDMF